ncbi:MAG: relaxase/mobilization nuclease domain-containing protein [Clostridium sp.]
MAYTSIIPVHRLDRSIDYIKDREKTIPKGKVAGSLEEALEYAMNRDKTEQAVFEDSIGCTCEGAYADMVATKQRFHKMDGVQGYHLIQSFAAEEVTPQLAHLIGQEFAEQLLKGRFEAVITTHFNTSHYHNHIVFNSVSMEDGKKYHSNSTSYYEDVRKISDGLCRKYGLSIIEPTGEKGKNYAQWQAEKCGEPTWRTGIRVDIREAVQESFTWKQFVARMEQKGYAWKLNRKYISLRAPGMERFVRLKSLGKNYSETAIREWILKPKSREKIPAGKENTGKGRKLHGLQALYYSYLYQMGGLKRKPARTYYPIRQEIRRLDEHIEQMEFLQKHGITTREQLADYRKPLEEQVLELTKERQHLYRKEPDSPRITDITKTLKPLRKEIKLCVRIDVHSREIEQRLQNATQYQQRTERERMEQEERKQKNQKEQEKDNR